MHVWPLPSVTLPPTLRGGIPDAWQLAVYEAILFQIRCHALRPLFAGYSTVYRRLQLCSPHVALYHVWVLSVGELPSDDIAIIPPPTMLDLLQPFGWSWIPFRYHPRS